MKYSKAEIMVNAWKMVKSEGCTMSAALKKAWAQAKAAMKIQKFEAAGFKRWIKGDMDRLYINAETLGLEYSCYKTGNISSSSFRGESISHRKAGEMLNAKIWVDVKTGKLMSKYASELLLDAAQVLYDQIMAA